MAADAEIISVLVDALSAVGLANSVVHISHRRLLERIAVANGVPEAQAATVYRSVDKLDKIGADGVKTELLYNEKPDYASKESVAFLLKYLKP